MRRLLPLAALALVLVPLAAAQEDEVTKLPAPTWISSAPTKAPPAGAPHLELVSSRANAITDVGSWFRRNRLTLREYRLPGTFGDEEIPLRALPAGVPTRFAGLRLVRAIYQGGTNLLVYGRDFSSGSILVVGSRVLDFSSFAHPPRTSKAYFGQITWVVKRGNVVYVETAHRGYARETRGLNAYITAVDVRTGKILWRSGSLVGNAQTFDVVGNLVIAGYGFTAEADSLYLLDRRDGKIFQRVDLPSAPEYIIRRGREVFVRTYDRDVVVEIRA